MLEAERRSAKSTCSRGHRSLHFVVVLRLDLLHVRLLLSLNSLVVLFGLKFSIIVTSSRPSLVDERCPPRESSCDTRLSRESSCSCTGCPLAPSSEISRSRKGRVSGSVRVGFWRGRQAHRLWHEEDCRHIVSTRKQVGITQSCLQTKKKHKTLQSIGLKISTHHAEHRQEDGPARPP